MIKVYREWYAEWCFAIRVLPPDRAVISGIITDEKGKPMPDVYVRLEQDGEAVIQTVTDASGHYWVGVYPVSGSYDLFATADELGSLRLGIQLDAGERLTLNLTLKEAVSIEGTVLMLDNTTPHVAVPVQAIRDGRVAATVLTDERGEYRFTNLKPGQYQLRCHALGRHVYYGEGKTGKPGSGEGAGKPISLQIQQGEALKNIDFRFAPIKKGTWKHYKPFDGLAHDTVNCIYAASDGTMWFGTDGGGVSRYDGREFVNLTTEDGLPLGVIWSIYEDADGAMIQ